MSISNYAEDQLLDALFNADTTGFPAGDAYLQLHSGDPGEAGTTNIVDIARVSVAFPASSGGTLANTANTDFVTMPAVTAPGVVAWSFWDVADATPTTPAGNCLWTGWFSTTSGLGVVRTADATANDVQSQTHGLANNDIVIFEALEGLTVPTGLTAGTIYYVIATGLTTDAFRVSTTQGGGAVDITGNGSAVWRKVVGKTTNSGDTFRVAASGLNIYLD